MTGSDFSADPEFAKRHPAHAPIILLDMDGVLVDLEGYMYEQWDRLHPTDKLVPRHKRTTFYMSDDHPDEYQKRMRDLMCKPGTFRNPAPVDGAIEVAHELLEFGEVFICTSPMFANPTCMQDKITWVERHLGDGWRERVVIAKDKTTVRGTWLVDDRPEVKGILTPVWEHIVFGHPYNRHVDGTRVADWYELYELAKERFS